MPRVPAGQSSSFFADASAPDRISPVRGPSPSEAAIPGEQLSRLGESISSAGSMALNIATDMQEQANQVRLLDAMNRMRASMNDLTYSKERGFRNLHGEAAIYRPDGRDLSDEYSELLSNSASEIEASLGNDRQKQDFQLRSAELMTAFRSDVQAHQMREFDRHSISVADGSFSLAIEDAMKNWDNQDKISESLDRAKTAIIMAGKTRGESSTEMHSKMRVAESALHASVIETAMSASNPTYASKYFAANAAKMTFDDTIKAEKALRTAVSRQKVEAAVEKATRGSAELLEPTDSSVIWRLLLLRESGGKQLDRITGAPITSKKGAIGIAQVMPETAREVAKKHGIEFDEQKYKYDETYNSRLGRLYLDEQLKTFGGNVRMALAAYNAGPGRVKTAMKMATLAGKPEKWLDYTPNETQEYVTSIWGKYTSGAGRPKPIGKQEFIDSVVSQLGESNPDERARATQAAEHRFSIIQSDRKAKADDAYADAIRALEQSGGNMNSIPPAIMARVEPEKKDNLLSIAKRFVEKSDDTNLSVYLYLSDDEKLKRMSDAQMFAMKGELSEADLKHFVDRRQRLITNQVNDKKDTSGDLNTSAINSAIATSLRMSGRDPTPKDGSKEAQVVGLLHKIVREAALRKQAQLGRTMSDGEVEQFYGELMSRNVQFRSTFLGVPYGTAKQQQILSMMPGDVPADTRDRIKRDFAARGIEPSEVDILGAYMRLNLIAR